MTEKTYGGFTIAKLKEMCAINLDPYDLISLAVPDLINEIEQLQTQIASLKETVHYSKLVTVHTEPIPPDAQQWLNEGE